MSTTDIFPVSTEHNCLVSAEHIFSLEEQKSVLSQQFRLWTPQIRGRAQNHQNGPKWVQNGRQASRIGQNESKHGSEAFPTGPGAENPANKARNLKSACPGPRSRVRLLRFAQIASKHSTHPSGRGPTSSMQIHMLGPYNCPAPSKLGQVEADSPRSL